MSFSSLFSESVSLIKSYARWVYVVVFVGSFGYGAVAVSSEIGPVCIQFLKRSDGLSATRSISQIREDCGHYLIIFIRRLRARSGVPVVPKARGDDTDVRCIKPLICCFAIGLSVCVGPISQKIVDDD